MRSINFLIGLLFILFLGFCTKNNPIKPNTIPSTSQIDTLAVIVNNMWRVIHIWDDYNGNGVIDRLRLHQKTGSNRRLPTFLKAPKPFACIISAKIYPQIVDISPLSTAGLARLLQITIHRGRLFGCLLRQHNLLTYGYTKKPEANPQYIMYK
jgi:hypothetical protein